MLLNPIVKNQPDRENYYPAQSITGRFGVRLRTLRQERKLTQATMAHKFGIDRTYISDVERGRKSISLPMIQILALGMKVSISDLMKDL